MKLAMNHDEVSAPVCMTAVFQTEWLSARSQTELQQSKLDSVISNAVVSKPKKFEVVQIWYWYRHSRSRACSVVQG